MLSSKCLLKMLSSKCPLKMLSSKCPLKMLSSKGFLQNVLFSKCPLKMLYSQFPLFKYSLSKCFLQNVLFSKCLIFKCFLFKMTSLQMSFFKISLFNKQSSSDPRWHYISPIQADAFVIFLTRREWDNYSLFSGLIAPSRILFTDDTIPMGNFNIDYSIHMERACMY